MKSTDKFLIGIVGGIVLIVVAAIAVVLLRPKPEYRPENTPEDIVHNYLLALKKGDYERAYNYLSPKLKDYPEDTEAFTDDIDDHSGAFSLDENTSLNVQSSRITGERSTVKVLETAFYGGGLFDSGQHDYTFDMKLRLEDGIWKLVDGDSYWVDCWEDASNFDC